MNSRSLCLLVVLITSATPCVAEVPCQAENFSDILFHFSLDGASEHALELIQLAGVEFGVYA